MGRILVIDDRASNRDLLVTLLQYHGHDVEAVADGAEGLAAVRARRPDLIICDVLMPVMDGYEFVRQLRSIGELADIEVVFCTAYFHEHEAYRLARSCGVRHILSKPCDPEETLALVDRLLTAPMPSADAADPGHAALEQDTRRLFTNRLLHVQDKLDRTTEALGSIVTLNIALAGQKTPTALLETLCAGMQELFGAGYVMAYVKARSGFSPTVHASAGLDPPPGEATLAAIDAHPGFPAMRAREGGIWIERSSGNPQTPLPTALPHFERALRAPIASSDRCYGWLLVADPHRCSREGNVESQMLAMLAAHAGRVHENHCLYLRARKQADSLQAEVATRTGMQRRIELQYAVAHVFVDAPSFEEAADRLLHALADRLDFEQAILWEVDVHNGRLRLVGSIGSVNDAPECLEPAAGVAGMCWARSQPVWGAAVEHAASHRDVISQVREQGTHVAFPVHLHEQLIGVIELRSWESRPPSIDLMESLGSVGSQIAQFLERRSQHAQILRLNRIHAVLSGINSAIVRIDSQQALLERACEIATRDGCFATAWIALTDGNRYRTAAASTAPQHPEWLALAADGIATAPAVVAGKSQSDGQPAWVNDLLVDPAVRPNECRLAIESGMRAFIALPLRLGERVVGMMCLFATEPGIFNEGERALLAELAGDISFALETMETRESLAYLRQFEPLTGLPNRCGAVDRLRMLISAACRDGEKVAVACFDIKRFRHINETFGREQGDYLLREFACRLRQHWPDPVNLANLGGDLFVAAIRSAQADYDIAKQLLRWPGRDVGGPFDMNGYPLLISARAGVAMFPSDAGEAGALLDKAEAALRSAKLSGQQYAFFEPSMSAHLSDSLLLESRLRKAVAEQQFSLSYQPKVSIPHRRCQGVEALLRWTDPERGEVSPEQFVPVLEETGLILEVGVWAMEQALREMRDSDSGSKPPRRVAVNVSPLQLGSPAFVSEICRILGLCHSADPGLDLEITESLIMEQVEENIAKLSELRSLGVRTSIDDFGTGYSSLAYLARLPVDALKIDRAFVDQMTESPESLAIVGTTISLAHSLGLKVVAEGVETEQQASLLAGLGCDEMQGYLVARPMPAHALMQWFADHRGIPH